MHTRSGERALRRLGARQHGVASGAQLRAIGLSEDAVERRVASGRFRRLYRGVFAVGPAPLTPHGRRLAAVLACGDGATLSHQSAGHAWALVREPRQIHVTCRRSRPPGPGIVVHRSRLDESDRMVLDDIPITTVARTLVDLAGVLMADRLADAVNEAEVRRRFDLEEVTAAQARAPNRRGSRKLNRVLANWEPDPFTRARSERLFLALCKRHGLPRPHVNTWIGEQEVDFAWPAHALAVEVDGGSVHRTRRAFQEDRSRDRRLAVKGIQVLRVTWLDLQGNRDELATQLKHILAARSPC